MNSGKALNPLGILAEPKYQSWNFENVAFGDPATHQLTVDDVCTPCSTGCQAAVFSHRLVQSPVSEWPRAGPVSAVQSAVKLIPATGLYLAYLADHCRRVPPPSRASHQAVCWFLKIIKLIRSSSPVVAVSFQFQRLHTNSLFKLTNVW